MINIKKEIPLKTIIFSLFISFMIVLLLSIILNTSHTSNSLGIELLKINETQTQSANAVTSVVTYFRGLDTLGEVTILFLAVFGIGFGLDKNKERLNIFSYRNTLLQTGVKVLFPLIILFGIYIIIHGHISPGGGFQGGVIIASAFLLKFLAYGDKFSLNHNIITIFESLSGFSFILVGILGVITLDMFFANFLPLGEMGDLFSSGIIPLIYIFVGLKVAAEITVLVEYILKVKDA
ncbi:MAG: MnhB domain-containing protein [Campylobacterota bacterium]|nr:MnhB domain-containing protein [Campylobacterota bacterium]